MLVHSLRFGIPGLLCLLVIAVGLLTVDDPHATAAPTAERADTGKPEHTRLTLAADAADDEHARLRSINSGYLSPVNETEQPFTHMMLRWEASGPVSGTLALEVRASIDGDEWGEWWPVQKNEDLWMPEDGPEVFWSQIIYADDGANFWQVRATITPTAEGEKPDLRMIDVNTVDGRYAEDQKPEMTTRDAQLANLNKPLVVSRTAWGCPDGQGSRVPPAYYPVNHMVVHHTADPNTFRSGERNWADRVRAIWAFHTYPPPSGRGWGDVGYNFLIDPNGTIYEGRSGGDNAVGFHDTGNYGSMGVSLVGTYQSVAPPPAMQNSLVSLLAWKAEQRGIDPLGSSYYYGCDISSFCWNAGAVTLNISGHRHVTARTSCPGDAAFNLLPSIRQRVRDTLDGGGIVEPPPKPDNGDSTIDELEDTFARSDAQWYSASCGYDSHTFYTFATDSEEEATNSATWRPNIPETGRYRVRAAIPQGCGLASAPYATTQARYHIVHAEGTTITDPVDHNTADAWVDLGSYIFNAGNDGAVELYDLTSEPFSERKIIFFDSIRFERVEDFVAVELVDVTYGDGSDDITVEAGELLPITFTVRNTGDLAVETQAPQADTAADDITFATQNGYAYGEDECFLGAEGRSYPAYPKEADRFRLTLGSTDPNNREVICNGESGGYPWRWGINGPLQPGETRDIVGYIRFYEPGQVTLQTGLIEEYVKYHAQNVFQATITVVEEREAPILMGYNAALEPLAHVYQLRSVPTNLLARTRNPLSLLRGEYVGSFPWSGEWINWGEAGPLEQQDLFLVEQTRVISVPSDGEYTFRTTTDDGSWLWIDGQEVVVNHGLPDDRGGLTHDDAAQGETRVASGTIALEAGYHILAFKYFEYTNQATVRYEVLMPGESDFGPVRDGLTTSSKRIGNTFVVTPELVLAADDQAGSGVTTLSYSLNDSEWAAVNAPGGLLNLGEIVSDTAILSGTNTLRYRASDSAANESAVTELTFTFNPDLKLEQIFLPTIYR